MAKPPFRVAQPPAASSTSDNEAKSPVKGDVFKRAAETGDVYEAALEKSAPDHPPAIPWPPALGVAHNPMKLK